MAGGHRLQHVEDFGAADLADHDSVGAHSKTVLDQVALSDFAAPFEIGGAGLEANDVRLLQRELGGILDGDDSLVLGNERGETIEHRGFARARSAADDYVQARADHGEQEFDQVPGERLLLDQRTDIETMLAESANRERGPVERERRYDRVDTRTVGEARVDHRR